MTLTFPMTCLWPAMCHERVGLLTQKREKTNELIEYRMSAEYNRKVTVCVPLTRLIVFFKFKMYTSMMLHSTNFFQISFPLKPWDTILSFHIDATKWYIFLWYNMPNSNLCTCFLCVPLSMSASWIVYWYSLFKSSLPLMHVWINGATQTIISM